MKQEVKKVSTTKSTFDRLMKDKSFKAKFEKEYDALNLSETLIELMESQKVSVRELSKKANVSSTVIQEIRSGKQDNPTLLVLSKLIHTLGGEIVIKKGKKTLASV
ncbi:MULTISPECIES: helix-turn-helix domain-containing protein [Leptospira]|jgi:predicted transcriptional regulator|uniref:helix-turn-helix domain-containing protein n=1 Tax=Leptospira TaxID=171 RepID=UPI000C2B1291|nr:MULTISPECIES: helix-turn-helix transcriptional regulator [Leptospira]PJZ43732.1 transcriptional regulator [Leptospira brenneri]PJZ79201.1 transcriptional regulator [Leptospira meyeri]PJZ95063.1 transcriptional regulator [Leptospira meyeri]PKA10395.1 transcriptional regulator [Leptospira meyeri]